YNAKLMALFAANQIPEVFADYAAGFGTFLLNSALADLTPFVQADKIDLAKTFDPSAITALTRSGKLYGMPIGDDPQLLFYNQTLFEKAGVNLPPTDWSDKKWTLDVMLAAAKKLSHDVTDPRKGEWGIIFDAGQLGTRSWLWGVDPFNKTGGPEQTKGYETGKITEVDYTNPKFVEAMQWIADLALKEKASPHPSDVQALQQGVGDAFMTGRIGMFAQGIWEFRSFRTAKVTWKWGMAPMPYGPTGINTDELFNNAYFLGQGAKHPAEGYQFLKFLLLGNPTVDYVQTVGEWPARLDLYDQAIKAIAGLPGMTQTEEEIRQVVTGAFDHGFETPGKTIDRYVEFNNAWVQTSAPIWTGQASAADGLKQVQAKMQTLVNGQ
ncbi:MAG TPA: extracellular solute-binding protein, partial [Chloroflexota bacterium]|nr:extracellular solute-binding protein [Chloroflexota bacterium]